jgi:hypothetical protein
MDWFLNHSTGRKKDFNFKHPEALPISAKCVPNNKQTRVFMCLWNANIAFAAFILLVKYIELWNLLSKF